MASALRVTLDAQPCSVDEVKQASQKPFYAALLGVGLVLVVALSFAIYNIVSHASHKISVTPVAVSVDHVIVDSPSQVTVVATVQSEATITAEVSCLVGVEMPATPLAYPIHVTETLAPGEQRTISVTRNLIKPLGAQVQTSDVAFTCT